MVGHLHLEAGLQDLAHQRRQQPVVAGQLDPPLRARSTSSAAQSRIAGSSPTDGTLRPDELGAGSDTPLDKTESEEDVVTVVILSGPRHPDRGPSDHARLHTPSDSPRGGRGRCGSNA
jgi:hypothetical protein